MSQAYEQAHQIEGIPLRERHDFYMKPEANRQALSQLATSEMSLEQLYEKATRDVFGSLLESAESRSEVITIPGQNIDNYRELLENYSKADDEPDFFLIEKQDLESYRQGKQRVRDAGISNLEEHQDFMDELSGLSGLIGRASRGKDALNSFYDWGMAFELENLYWRVKAEELSSLNSDKELDIG
jgi:uncharacterized Zn finger protein